MEPVHLILLHLLLEASVLVLLLAAQRSRSRSEDEAVCLVLVCGMCPGPSMGSLVPHQSASERIHGRDQQSGCRRLYPSKRAMWGPRRKNLPCVSHVDEAKRYTDVTLDKLVVTGMDVRLDKLVNTGMGRRIGKLVDTKMDVRPDKSVNTGMGRRIGKC
ncbi:hypothetical protein RRG08_042828 [Elysia crispata]|uniref:Uncharacterized protein n=1 Tax=Elysia crispata TaxID=231223 RepID=A0AAE1A9R7_9GAST|nr:hypothetical protein RRG08_042828 [Elysia crispata]